MRISMKEIWRNLDGPPKNKELWSYVVKFEFKYAESTSPLSYIPLPTNHFVSLFCLGLLFVCCL